MRNFYNAKLGHPTINYEKNLFNCAIAAAMITSCDNDSQDSNQQSSIVQKETNSKPQTKSDEDDILKYQRIYDVEYQNSEDANDPLNGKISFVAYITKDGLPPAFGTETRGYFYSESSGCFIYGTWISWPSGIRIFKPADAATQYLLNRCGYENVA